MKKRLVDWSKVRYGTIDAIKKTVLKHRLGAAAGYPGLVGRSSLANMMNIEVG